MNALTKRCISSIVISAATFFIIFFTPNWAYCLFVSSLIGISLREFYGLVSKKGLFVYRYFGIAAGMIYPVIIFLQMGVEGFAGVSPFFIVLACLFTFVLQITRRDSSKSPISSIAVTMFGLLYISWFFSFFINLKYVPNGNFLILYLVLVTKSSDIGAFFFGSSFGTHSLIPRISPKKTIEGTIGGIFSGILVSILSKAFLPAFTFFQLAALGILLSIIGQVGDLAESLIKRDCAIKDSGSSLPGYGGMLDMLDSLLFTAPIFYFYIKVILK